MMRFGGQYGLMLVLAIVPAAVLAKDKSAPAHVVGNPGSFFGADAYPPEAIRAEEQGRSVVTVAIDASGIATGCTTTASSGSTSLDAKTCSIAMTSLHYTAAHDSHGRAVAGSYTLPVRWVLPADAPASDQTFITFSGTAAAPVCSVVVTQVARHIVPAKCRAIVNVLLSHGGNLSQQVSIGTPNESDLSPLGE